MLITKPSHSYYGPGDTVDTSKVFTVTTQFITSDGTTTGNLVNITRKYIQNGVAVRSAVSTGDTIQAALCSSGAAYGGLTTMGQALGRGMVLAFSIWNDNSQYMNWLDSGSNGPCSSTAGNPSTILAQDPNTHVIFSNIRWGDIGSTTGTTTGGSSSSSSATSSKTSSSTSSKTSSTQTTKTSTTLTTKTSTTTTATGAKPTCTAAHWGQCAGIGYTGCTVCAAPYTCQFSNDCKSLPPFLGNSI